MTRPARPCSASVQKEGPLFPGEGACSRRSEASRRAPRGWARPRCCTARASASATASAWPSTASPSPSPPRSATACSGRTGPARRRPSPCCAGSPCATRARSPSTGIEAGTLEAKAAVGYVPQDLALYPDLSATENLTFFGQLYGLSGKELEGRIRETLELVGLADRGKDRIGTYSGGMKRRANMAAGLLHRPKLLVLDEPTVGVDPQSRNAILETVGASGHRRALHDALHGGGGQAVRPHRHHR